MRARFRHLARRLGASRLESESRRLLAVALCGFLLDGFLFLGLVFLGVSVPHSQIASFAFAFAATSARLIFRRPQGSDGRNGNSLAPPARGVAFVAAAGLLAFFLRAGVFALLVAGERASAAVAIFPAALAGAAVQYAAWLSRSTGARDPDRQELGWRALGIGVVAYATILRLVYAGQVDLIPQEAYYWNYAQHPDLGYLDHPPMVAWLIAAGTSILGTNELGVRIGAIASWSLALAFVFCWVRRIAGKTEAWVASVLMSVLPFFFGVGFLMMPDAPLVPWWAGALYFLDLALLRNREWGWLGVGACLGLGMLSKYTVALVGLAAFVFMLLDRQSRARLLRPWPYAAALLGSIIFAPVIVWNATHHWASFLFQGPERMSREPRFHLHVLAAFVLLLVTPVGLAAFGRCTWRKPAGAAPGTPRHGRRDRLFVIVMTAVPLLVFAFASLRAVTKVNWTGPVWLATLPAMACGIVGNGSRGTTSTFGRLTRQSVLGLLVIYGLLLYSPVLGLPGIRLPRGGYGMNWHRLGAEVEAIEDEVIRETGSEPLVVGMDKYYLSSELAFYDPKRDGAQETAGWGLFDVRGLMYDFWFPAARQTGKNLILVATRRDDLDSRAIRAHSVRQGPIRRLCIPSRLAIDAEFFARVAYRYDPRGCVSTLDD